MKKIIIQVPRIVEILAQTRKPSLKKSKVIPSKKGGAYNRAKIKAKLLKNS